MTSVEIFQKAKEFLNHPKKCIGTYRSQNGECCVIGFMLPDYHQSYEGKTIEELCDTYPTVREAFPDVQLMMELQEWNDLSDCNPDDLDLLWRTYNQ